MERQGGVETKSQLEQGNDIRVKPAQHPVLVFSSILELHSVAVLQLKLLVCSFLQFLPCSSFHVLWERHVIQVVVTRQRSLCRNLSPRIVELLLSSFFFFFFFNTIQSWCSTVYLRCCCSHPPAFRLHLQGLAQLKKMKLFLKKQKSKSKFFYILAYCLCREQKMLASI